MPKLEISSLKSTLQKEITELEGILKQLPKGTIQTKEIKNNEYLYLAYRDREKVKTKYLGKPDTKRCKRMLYYIENRDQIECLLKEKQRQYEELELKS